jgi:hypothetical protein
MLFSGPPKKTYSITTQTFEIIVSSVGILLTIASRDSIQGEQFSPLWEVSMQSYKVSYISLGRFACFAACPNMQNDASIKG